MSKRRVLLLFGGQSGEHEVSVVSATHVQRALDPARYDVTAVGIAKDGAWVNLPSGAPLMSLDDPTQAFQPARIGTGSGALSVSGSDQQPVDVVLPILHGPKGEDGTVQGLLELTGIPYVGCGVLASAVAMDKITAKRVFRDAGIPVVPGELVLSSRLGTDERVAVLDRLEEAFMYPMFVKPSNLGSSVGVSKAVNREQLAAALEMAAGYDRRILVEPAVAHAREIEVAILGNDSVRVSVPGEIIPDREFYDYESKYADSSTSEPIIPARLPDQILATICEYAELAFRSIDGAGMARVDFLVNGETNEIFLNEINTIPGFTPISMYAKLWEASGMSYGQLLDELIRLAIERATDKQHLKTSR